MITFRSAAPSLLGCLLAVFPLASSAQPAAYWGIEFPTSQDGPAQQHFLEGVTAMHLHMFEDAEEHFRAAQELAPDFVMAYWGAALNNHRTIWSIHRAEDARAVLGRLGPTPAERAAKAPTARERAYLEAVEILFGAGTQQQRQAAYAQAMRRLSETYPGDMEARAWYALSLMRETPPEMTRERTRSLMAALALEVLAANPRHPGANRYLIQSTDDPENTDLGVIAVNNLEGLEIEAAEALHIPSHYYIQHGMWLETAQSNMRAFESSMQWVQEHDWQLQDLNQHNYGHLLQFAHYGFLQAGVLGEAALLRERIMGDFRDSDGAAEIATPLADTHARLLVDLEQWQDAPGLAALARQQGLSHANLWTAIGIAAVRLDNPQLAREALEVLAPKDEGSASEAAIGALQVEGLLLIAEGDRAQGLARLQQSIGLHERMTTEQPVTLIGIPPRPVKPTRELLGEVLLEGGDSRAALEQFEQALTIYQGRTNLLRGALEAARATGDEESAERYRQRLAHAWRAADAGHPFAATSTGAPAR